MCLLSLKHITLLNFSQQTEGYLIVARGKKCSSLYWTKASVSVDSINSVECDNQSELWNRRLSHISVKGLNCLAKKNLFSG